MQDLLSEAESLNHTLNQILANATELLLSTQESYMMANMTLEVYYYFTDK